MKLVNTFYLRRSLKVRQYNAHFMSREAYQRFTLKNTVISQSDSESPKTIPSPVAS